MQPTYKIVKVYSSASPSQCEFYVVNTVTRKVQSTWKMLCDAHSTCNKLNALIKKGLTA